VCAVLPGQMQDLFPVSDGHLSLDILGSFLSYDMLEEVLQVRILLLASPHERGESFVGLLCCGEETVQLLTCFALLEIHIESGVI
jgi:hypothetical protein